MMTPSLRRGGSRQDDNRAVFVFPGQGSQFVGMGRELYEQSPAARAVFDQADEVLGTSISKLCFEGPEEDLDLAYFRRRKALIRRVSPSTKKHNV